MVRLRGKFTGKVHISNVRVLPVLYSVQKRVFTAADAGGRSAAVPDAGAVLAEHSVQPGGRFRVPARAAVAPPSPPPPPQRSAVVAVLAPVVVPAVRRPQGAVPADNRRQPVAGSRRRGRGRVSNVVARAAQPVVVVVIGGGGGGGGGLVGRVQPRAHAAGPTAVRRDRCHHSR